MMPTCATCQYFRETVVRPSRESKGECRRYPIPIAPIARTYWCGEFKKQKPRSRR